MLLIKNARILSMEETDYENGFLISENGKISDIGDMTELKSDKADTVIDAAGEVLMPGLVDAHCHIGMWEEGTGFDGDDGNEDTDPIMPQLRAIDAVNPFDEAFKNAVRAGVTAVVTGPGSANVFGGQFAAIKTYGNCVDKMIIKAPVAQKAALGENPKVTYGEKHQQPSTRMATAALVRETLYKAIEYKERLDKYNEDSEENDKPDYDTALESLLPVLKKEIPLKIHAHRADDICTALRIKKEFDIKITLEHCTEGHLIADIIKESKVPVMLGPTFGSKSKAELKNMSFDIYKKLSQCGVKFAIITDHPEIPINYLPLCASLAVKNGMDRREALRAITIYAAENTGISDRVGSLKAGKDADFILVDKDILEFDARVLSVFIDGKQISL